jgi:hypothetical protein
VTFFGEIRQPLPTFAYPGRIIGKLWREERMKYASMAKAPAPRRGRRRIARQFIAGSETAKGKSHRDGRTNRPFGMVGTLFHPILPDAQAKST